MPITVGKHKFTFKPDGILRASHAWIANDHRLIVRKSVVRPNMWCADYKVGSDSRATLHRKDGMARRFKTKENAMAALVKFWDNI